MRRSQPMYVGNLFVIVHPDDQAELVRNASRRRLEIIYPNDPEFRQREEYGKSGLWLED